VRITGGLRTSASLVRHEWRDNRTQGYGIYSGDLDTTRLVDYTITPTVPDHSEGQIIPSVWFPRSRVHDHSSIVASAAIDAAVIVLPRRVEVESTVASAAWLCQIPGFAQHSTTMTAYTNSDDASAHGDSITCSML